MISRPSIALTAAACMTTAIAPSGSAQGRDTARSRIAPPVIGGLSDAFTLYLGNDTEGLRWALIVSAIFYPWAALHFWLASRSIAQEFED